jgi:4,5-DOPA dioxygenase extradiol
MKMPLVFAGHGNPMNAIEDNEFSRAWTQLGRELPRPRAILCVSAHWETDGTCVTSAQMPETIHDFSGFPAELNHMRYPAPGSPALARKVMDSTRYARIRHDRSWGLDHGAWSVLCRMYPRADIPVVQLSLDTGAPPYFHYELGR